MKINSKSYPIVVLTIILICSLGLIFCTPEKGEQTVIYKAKKIITMDESRPEATAVAVADAKIIAVGSLEVVQQKLEDGNYTVDNQFQDKVLVPGFIDNHLHPLLVGGFVLQMKFITPFDWNLPSGPVKGVRGKDAYLDRLKEIEAEMMANYNFEAKRWVSLPLGMRIGKLTQIGKLPVRFFADAEYNFADRGVAPRWILRFGIVPLL